MSGVCVPLHVCGYSARGAVQAATRLGFACEGWDCFGDRDASRLAPWHRIAGLRGRDCCELLRRPSATVLPCGGLENRPALWAMLADRHRLIGPTPPQLRQLRDPRWLNDFCRRQVAMRFPECRFGRPGPNAGFGSSSETETDGGWLVKPRRSGGGVHVRRHCAGAPDDAVRPMQRGEYLQRFIAGDEYSAVLRCGVEPSLLFASRPWPGGRSAGPAFTYRGSIGPMSLPPRLAQACLVFAAGLSREIGFGGVLQVDLIADEAGEPYLLEVNPRWSGSMELAELLSPGSIIGEFFSESRVSERTWDADFAAARVILYADSELFIDGDTSDAMDREAMPSAMGHGINRGGCWVADVPCSGAAVAAGSPVCTLIAAGNPAAIADELARGEARWRAVLGEAKMRSVAGSI